MLSAYAEAARAAGLEPFSMMRKAGLPPEALDQPDFKISAERVRSLIDTSTEISGCEDFGLMVGRAGKLSMMGTMGLFVRNQATVRQAIEAMARYPSYQNNTVSLRLEAQQDALVLELRLLSAALRGDPQIVDLTLAGFVQNLRGLLGEAWQPAHVGLARPAPRDQAPYSRMFGKVDFAQQTNDMVLASADIDVAIPGADPHLARELARYIERSGGEQAVSMTERVRELITRLLPTGHCTIDLVAQYLGVDRRTVHRRLMAEETSFTELVDDTRRDLVATHLNDADPPLTAVADLLGFSSLSTFSRWFRQTYGMSAREFRGSVHARRGGGSYRRPAA
jgi:AraC-like DNA-binding protein